MNTVILADATKTSRTLSRAIAKAVDDLRAKTRSPQFLPGWSFWLVGEKATLARVYESEELTGVKTTGPRPFDYLFGLPVKVDPTQRPGILLVLDPRSYTSETVEVY